MAYLAGDRLRFMLTAGAAATSLQASATLWAAVIAGVFALTAAVLGAVNAYQARKWVRREQWWTRFSWASEKSVSQVPGESELGLSVLYALLDAPWTTEEDNEMAIEVINVIVTNDDVGASATEPERSDEGQSKDGEQ